MTCQDVQKLLSAWRDGEAAVGAGLSSEERLSVRRHLDECAACRDALARLERTVSGVRELTAPTTAPPPVTMRALALGRQHAHEMSKERQEEPVTMVAAAPSAVRYATAARAAPAAPATPAPLEQLSSKRPSRFRLVLLVGLGLVALLLLTALALGFRF